MSNMVTLKHVQSLESLIVILVRGGGGGGGGAGLCLIWIGADMTNCAFLVCIRLFPHVLHFWLFLEVMSSLFFCCCLQSLHLNTRQPLWWLHLEKWSSKTASRKDSTRPSFSLPRPMCGRLSVTISASWRPFLPDLIVLWKLHVTDDASWGPSCPVEDCQWQLPLHGDRFFLISVSCGSCTWQLLLHGDLRVLWKIVSDNYRFMETVSSWLLCPV